MSTTIEQFIQSFETKNNVKISNHHIEINVVKPGDNICSGIIRLHFEYEKEAGKKSNSVILKIPSLTILPWEVIKKTIMFTREVHFYTKILPVLYQLGNCEPFAPILYTATENGAMAMEDLTVEGYKPGDRLEQLNIDEAMETLNVLATYHALSYKYLQTLSKDDPTRPLIGVDQVLTTLKEASKKPTFDNFCQMVKPHLSESLYNKILTLEDKILADPVLKTSPEENSIIVITHDDCRPNNILFKYDNNGIATQAKLIDWQGSKEGSPVLDLIYFFVTAVRIDVYEANDNKLLIYYLAKLNAKLKSLEITRFYGNEELERDFADYRYFYLTVLSLTWQRTMLLEKQDEKDIYISRAVKWLNHLETIKHII